MIKINFVDMHFPRDESRSLNLLKKVKMYPENFTVNEG